MNLFAQSRSATCPLTYSSRSAGLQGHFKEVNYCYKERHALAGVLLFCRLIAGPMISFYFFGFIVGYVLAVITPMTNSYHR